MSLVDVYMAQTSKREKPDAFWSSHVLKTNARGSGGLYNDNSDHGLSVASRGGGCRAPARKGHFPGFMTPVTPYAATPERAPTPPRPPTPEEVRAARVVKKGKLHPGVTAEEVRRFQSIYREKLLDKFKTLRAAFRSFDKNASGSITMGELKFGLVTLNLDMVRHEVRVPSRIRIAHCLTLTLTLALALHPIIIGDPQLLRARRRQRQPRARLRGVRPRGQRRGRPQYGRRSQEGVSCAPTTLLPLRPLNHI